MEHQSIAKQIAVGAFFGVLFAMVNRLSDAAAEPFMSVGGLAYFAGSAVAGVVLYMVLYRIWPKKK